MDEQKKRTKLFQQISDNKIYLFAVYSKNCNLTLEQAKCILKCSQHDLHYLIANRMQANEII